MKGKKRFLLSCAVFLLSSCTTVSVPSDSFMCDNPTKEPSVQPTLMPTESPTVVPTEEPTFTRPETEYTRVENTLVIDRNFGFVISDPSGTIVFTGIVNNIK